MITIDDNDLPITAAEKIVTGTKPYEPTPFMRAFGKSVTGSEHACDTVDMFSVDEILEIADYLMVFYKSHLEESECDTK